MSDLPKENQFQTAAIDLNAITDAEFDRQVAVLKQRFNGPDDPIKRQHFSSWEDVVDLFATWEDAKEVELTKDDITELRDEATQQEAEIAKTSMTTATTSATSAQLSAAIKAKQAAKARSPQHASQVEIAKTSKTTAATSATSAQLAAALKAKQAAKARSDAASGPQRNSANSPLSRTVSPGVSDGPPKRFIGIKQMQSEIDHTVAKFRRQSRGVGKCTGNKLKAVTSAYAHAYVLCEGAHREVRYILKQGSDAPILWHASVHYREASLAYWFGADYDRNEIMSVLHEIEAVLREWSLAFCAGFRGLLPVFIRCKSVNPVGNTSVARHLVKNTIELSPVYFDRSKRQQTVIILHEMGHRSTGLIRPRDERHNLCTGGWNSKENMCYRDRDDVDSGDRIFRGGNPHALAHAATRGNKSAKAAALNNIDNYVCYMWNRSQDHGFEELLDLLSPGAKPARKSPGASKPAN